MNLRLQNRFLLSSISFGLLLIALIVLVIIPAMREIRLINKQVYEERLRLEKLYTRGQLQRTVKITYDKIKDNLPVLDKMMLKENQELQYITSLENIAQEENIELKISVGETKRVPEQKFSILPFNFELKGEWEAIMRWIARAESLDLYTNIKEGTIAVRAPENDQDKRTATASFLADTFWLIP